MVSPVGGPHSLRGVVGAAVVRNYRKTGVHAPKHLRRTPPPFLAARPFGNRHSKPLVYLYCEISIEQPWSNGLPHGTGRLTLRRKGAFRIRCRNAMGRPPARLDVDVMGFPRPIIQNTAPVLHLHGRKFSYPTATAPRCSPP